MSNYHVGDFGTVFDLDTTVDLSAATTLEIQYKKPDGTTGAWAGAQQDTTKIRYTILTGDWDQAGTCRPGPRCVGWCRVRAPYRDRGRE